MRKIFTLLVFCWVFSYSNAQCPQFLHIDTSFCSGGAINITANASILSTQLCGDSVTVLFNATGTTLDGDTNVYMHSSPELQVGEAWNGPTIGNWGQNDGVGRMTNVGTNLWAIRINPRTYYGYSIDSCLDGLWMVFRNFNGNIVTNNNGGNILIVDNNGTLTSAYTPVSGSTETHNNAVTYHWSDGNTSSTRLFTGTTDLSVTATGIGGCTATGSVVIKAGHAPVNIGNNILRCNTTPVTLYAGSGFVSYTWLNEASSNNSSFSAVSDGSYWVVAVDSANCISSDTITVTSSSVKGLLLQDSFTVCGTDTVKVNASTSINANGDSVTILYNAGLNIGINQLSTATKVYFHSSAQTPTSGLWGDNTVGNWALDDGVGEMTSLGDQMWSITIDPRNYYLLSPDTPLLGIFMVFRNADGDSVGKGVNGTNILLSLQSNPPTSAFTGVTATRFAAGPLTYDWSNGATTPATYFTSSNNYTVSVSDTHSCSTSQTITVTYQQSLAVNLIPDTVVCNDTLLLNAGGNYTSYVWSTGASTSYLYVTDPNSYTVTVTNNTGCTGSATVNVTAGPVPVVNLGPDTTDCSPVLLNAGVGFTSYAWSNGASSQSITVSTKGTYTVTVTNASGCKANSSVVIDSCATSVVVVGCGSPTAKFQVQSIAPGNTVTLIDSSLIAKPFNFVWNFGDGDTSHQTGSVVHTYAANGTYTVTLTIRDSCGGVSSVSEVINVDASGIASIAGLTALNVYPNPGNGNFNIELGLQSAQTLTISLVNQLGQTVQTRKADFQSGTNTMVIDAANFAAGIYILELLSNNERTIRKITISR